MPPWRPTSCVRTISTPTGVQHSETFTYISPSGSAVRSLAFSESSCSRCSCLNRSSSTGRDIALARSGPTISISFSSKAASLDMGWAFSALSDSICATAASGDIDRASNRACQSTSSASSSVFDIRSSGLNRDSHHPLKSPWSRAGRSALTVRAAFTVMVLPDRTCWLPCVRSPSRARCILTNAPESCASEPE